MTKRKKIAIVTGASSGFGKEFVKLLVKERNVDEIWAVARNEQKLEQLKKSFPGKVRTFSYDLSEKKNLIDFEKIIRQEKPRITYLVNNAGYGKFGDYQDLSLESSINMIDLNCSSVVGLGLICIPFMSAGSHIINIASQASFQPLPYLNLYSATKAFVRNYSRALNVELHEKRITVTAVCPGWMKTDFFARAEIRAEKTVSHFGLLSSPEKVAKKAFNDAKAGEDISIYSFYVKMCHFIAKVLPQKAMMRVWLWQQRIPYL